MKFTWLHNLTHVKVALVVVALLIAGASLIVSHALIRDLQAEERGNMEVWSEAMRALSNADESTDMGLVLKVINGNKYIPIVVLDNKGEVTLTRNISGEDTKTIEHITSHGHHLRINITPHDATAFIDVYYDESLMLTRLTQYPYVQLGVVGLFVAVAIFALLSSKRAEQNKVWVGLSRETAHQLGTPISSLMAWTEVLREQYPDDPLLPEMTTDVQRLQLIAERFSKIGSAPEITPNDLCEVVAHVAGYIHRRTSDKVSLSTSFTEEHIMANICPPLLEWVIENLCKNAIDAMQGTGRIEIYVSRQLGHILIEVADNGKGIERQHFKDVFRPGFTTKKRGWGLGLSLAKRIIEEYHHGRIYVSASEVGRGTTFAIELPET